MLLFGAEKWVVTTGIGRVLWGLQDNVEWQLMSRLPRRRLDKRWEYTSAKVAREEAGFELMKTYIWQRRNTVIQYIVTRQIMEL